MESNPIEVVSKSSPLLPNIVSPRAGKPMFGKGRICTLVPTSLHEASQWMDFQTRFWSGSLDRLAQFVRESND